ncbi:MAG: cell envelope integrity protein TolA [Stellaceae bacterium]
MHLLVVLAVVLGLPSVFQAHIDEDQPMVVELVNIGPKTLATMKAYTPPKAKAPPKAVQVEQRKPTPPQPPQSKPAPPPPPPAPKQAEVKTPEKPPPPKPEVAPQPPRPPQPLPPQKRQEMAFDTLLKNLASKPLPQNQPNQQPATKPQPSSQPIAPLGSQLSVSELDLVKQQIEQCWNVPAGARDAQNLTPEFRVSMNPDGTVRSATLMNPERLSDPFFQAAADSALRALRNPSCQPLKLPPQKYDQWQTFTITFDPKDLS